MDYALEVKGLSKTYKKSGFTLDNVSFTVPKGTIVGLVGETVPESLLPLVAY